MTNSAPEGVHFMEHNNQLALTLGDNIKNYRNKIHLRQKELAEKAGISANYLSLIESGKRYPSLSIIGKISEILGTTPAKLLDNDILLSILRELAQKYDKSSIIAGIEEVLPIINSKK